MNITKERLRAVEFVGKKTAQEFVGFFFNVKTTAREMKVWVNVDLESDDLMLFLDDGVELQSIGLLPKDSDGFDSESRANLALELMSHTAVSDDQAIRCLNSIKRFKEEWLS